MKEENDRETDPKNYKFTIQQRKRTGAYINCETCNREFYVFPSRIKQAELNGVKIRFCSQKCYIKTGENNPFWGEKHKVISIDKMRNNPNRYRFANGYDNPNYKRFDENFIGKNLAWWKRKLLETLKSCELCGYSDIRALCIHHKDRNRKNNTRDNLILLCWNCHAIEHFKTKTGMYHFTKIEKEKIYA